MQQTATNVDQVKVATQQTAVNVDQVKVAAQQTAIDIDHVKRLSSNLIDTDTMPYALLQGSNCEKAFTNGSPHRIPQQIITSHVIPITRKQRRGFFKAASFRNGSQQDHFFGFTENVGPVLFLTLAPSNTILYCSWLRQKRSMVGAFLIVLVRDNRCLLSVPL
jgi:hypothetical protein